MSEPPVFRPQSHSSFELVAMRVLFAFVVWDVIPWALPAQELSMPVGLAGMGLDLGFLADPAVMRPLNWLAIVLLVLYIAGQVPWLTTSLLCILCVLTGTYINSNGSIKHHHQIVSLVLLGQAIWHIWYPLRHRGHEVVLIRERWGAFVSQQVIAAVYVVTGLTKLIQAGLSWPVAGSRNYVVQIRKTNGQSYHDRLESASGISRRVEQFLLDHQTFTTVALSAGLLLELFAWVALLGRKWSLGYGILLLLFHFTNTVVMDLNFRWHNELIGIYLILPPLIFALQNWSEKRTRLAQHRSARA